MTPIRALSAGCVVALLLAGALACVDGKTPDCSDAAAGCGPDLVPSSDASPDAPSDAPPTDALADAADAADAGTATDAPAPTDARGDTTLADARSD
jgi:hypothetical protein